MRLLRNLSIARKLALSSCATLALLGTLVWSVMSSMSEQHRLSERVIAANDAERAGWAALGAVRQIRLASRDMEQEQAAPAVDQRLQTVSALSREAVMHLNAMRHVHADPELEKRTGSAIGMLSDYQAKLIHTAGLRDNMLTARDDRFFASVPAFDAALHALRDAIPQEGLLPNEAEELARQLDSYQEAVLACRDNAMIFLVTGTTGITNVVGNARIAMDALSKAVMGSTISDHLKSLAQPMFEAGEALRGSAADLFDADSTLQDFIAEEADPAADTLEQNLSAAQSAFADIARVAQAASAAGQEQAQARLLLISGVILVVLLASAWLTARAVAGPIGAMTRAVQRMAGGDTAQSVGFVGRRDEVGRMAAALEVLRAAVQQAYVQAQMIEQLPIGVMTCEAEGDFRITYMNAESLRLMRLVESHVAVPIASLLGTSIDAFHPAPERQRRLLSDPALLPYRAIIRIGAETLELKVSALRRGDGSYAGPMLNLHLVTRQVQLSDTFERSVAGIAQEVARSAAVMERTASAMSDSADGSGQRLAEVAEASQIATGNVQAVAANAEQLAASVAEIARQVSESAEIAVCAVTEAQATDRSVAGLAEAASRIGDVVRLIGDIAGRTNLLALNATIEAARAGDAGRGFAVVANEVKVLANQTARATQEIAAQITSMQGATAQAVGALRSIGGTITRMSEIATDIASAVELQGAATREIARSVQQVAAGTARVDSNIGELTQSVRRTGGQAGEVVGAARALNGQSDVLSREVTTFLGEMRAAA